MGQILNILWQNRAYRRLEYPWKCVFGQHTCEKYIQEVKIQNQQTSSVQVQNAVYSFLPFLYAFFVFLHALSGFFPKYKLCNIKRNKYNCFQLKIGHWKYISELPDIILISIQLLISDLVFPVYKIDSEQTFLRNISRYQIGSFWELSQGFGLTYFFYDKGRVRRNCWPVAIIFTVGPVKQNKDRPTGPVDILWPLGPATFASSNR